MMKKLMIIALVTACVSVGQAGTDKIQQTISKSFDLAEQSGLNETTRSVLAETIFSTRLVLDLQTNVGQKAPLAVEEKALQTLLCLIQDLSKPSVPLLRKNPRKPSCKRWKRRFSSCFETWRSETPRTSRSEDQHCRPVEEVGTVRWTSYRTDQEVRSC